MRKEPLVPIGKGPPQRRSGRGDKGKDTNKILRKEIRKKRRRDINRKDRNERE
jgi:hypothetical protein